MRKITLSLYIFVGLATLSTGIFIACSDYDDFDINNNESASVKEDVSVITTEKNKLVVTNANGYTYSYEENKCVKINGYEQTWDLSDVKNPVVKNVVFEDDYDYSAKLGFYANGYLSKLELVKKHEIEVEQQTLEVNYNAQNQISDFTYRSVMNFNDEHNSVEDYKYLVTYIYEDGNLTTAVVKVDNFEDFVDNGREYKDNTKEEYVFSFRYGDTENKYQLNLAYPIVGEYAFDYDELLQSFGFIGWLGKGSNLVPESYSYTYSVDGSTPEPKGPFYINYSTDEDDLISSWQYEEVF